MEYDVLLTRNPGNGYSARPLLWPEVIVSGADEAETLERARAAIVELQVNSRLVRLTVPLPSPTFDDPWLHFAGMWSDMPEEQWHQFQAAITTAREAMDQASDTMTPTDL